MEQTAKGEFWVTDRMVITAFGLAVVYWVVDAFLYLFAAVEINLVQRVFHSQWTGLYSRIVVICFFAIFGAHALYAINKRRQAEKELAQVRQQLDSLLAGQTPGAVEKDPYPR